MTSKTRLTLDLKNSESYDNLFLHRGDSNSRIIEIELTDNHAPVTLTSGMTATINASTNGIVVADGEKAMVDTANNIISFTVTDNMTSLPGQSKISITVSEGDTIITAQTFRAIVTDSVINEGSKFEPTGGTVKQFMDEVAAARGDYDNLNARFNSKIDNTAGSVKTDNIASKAVTNEKIANGAITALKIARGAVSGSNIQQNQISTNHLQNGAVTTDKLADDVKTTINSKATKATTIEGYGINDAYTKSETDNMLSGKLDNTAGSVTTDNIASKAVTNEKIANGAITALKLANNAVSGSNIGQNQISADHLQSGAVTTDKLADEVKTGISSKYDSSNVETGSGTLTPYTTSADIVKSADFTYQRVGRVVTVNVNIVFNAGTKSQVMFTNLPYVCKNTVNPRELCVSNSKVTRIWAINNNNTILNIISDSSLSYADGETLAFTLSYLIS